MVALDPGIGAVANATGDTVQAVGNVAEAAIQAQASKAIAKINARAKRYEVSVDESSEILSVLDRPFVRVFMPDDNLEVQMDISILSIMGILSCSDLYQGYRALWSKGSYPTNLANDATAQMTALAGTIPLDPRALAILSGVVGGEAPGTEHPGEYESAGSRLDQFLQWYDKAISHGFPTGPTTPTGLPSVR